MGTLKGHMPFDPSERAVVCALREQLPKNWLIVPNVRWNRRHGRIVRDHEADIVVFAPEFGMCVLEVKGSHSIRVNERGEWQRKEGNRWKTLDRTPYDQATSNAYLLAERLAPKHDRTKFPGLYGWMVVYPNGRLQEGSLANFDPSTLVLASDMSDLQAKIRASLRLRGPDGRGKEMTRSLALDLANELVGYPTTIVPDMDNPLEDLEKIERLAPQQCAALEGIFRHPRVIVTGPAGSGKTVLALWRLRALKEGGQKVRLICFNKTLAKHLQREHPDLSDSISTVSSFFMEVANSRPMPGSSDEARMKFFREELPGKVWDTVSFWSQEQKEAKSYDAILVDEAQDLGSDRLLAAQLLVREGGTFQAFMDNRQDLFDKGARNDFGREAILFPLLHNCRNTVQICETSNRVVDEHIKPLPGLPEGTKTVVQVHADPAAATKAAWKLMSEWYVPGENRAAFLSPFSLQKSSFAKPAHQKGHNLTLVQTLEDWEVDNTVLFSTIRGFKGLEADVIVVVDVLTPGEHVALGLNDLYVACTRARIRLGLVCRSEAARKVIEMK